jgi:hypothetical protein
LSELSRQRAAEGRLQSARQQFEDAAETLDAATYRAQLLRPSQAAPVDEEALKAAGAALVEARVAIRRAQQEWAEAVEQWLRISQPDYDEETFNDLIDVTRPLSEPELDTLLESVHYRQQALRQVAHVPRQAVLPLTLFFLALVIGAVVVLSSDSARWIAYILAVVVFLGLANLLVARATTRFAWYGITVFLSVLLFGASLSIARTMRTPKVQPAALVRKSDDVAICGIYITQTDDRVYLGRVEPDGNQAQDGTGRMFWVPVSDVDVVSVGPLQKIEKAKERAPKLVTEIIKDRAQETAQVIKPKTTTTEQGVAAAKTKKTTEVSESAVKAGRPTSRPDQKAPSDCATADL